MCVCVCVCVFKGDLSFNNLTSVDVPDNQTKLN